MPSNNSSLNIHWPPAGRYVVALSGGVDSVALLDLLAEAATARGYELTVAHFNHGWPGDDAYEAVARGVVARYGLPLKVERGSTKRSEAAAREARYGFLRRVATEVGATAIITAHHRDDLEETVALNVQRGTGRRGLTPFGSAPDLLRPLAAVRKAELRDYAAARGLTWCHDSYNDDLKFRRNQVRHELLPQLRQADPEFEARLARLIAEAAELNARLDRELDALVAEEAAVPLAALRRLDATTIQELLHFLANRAQPGGELDRRTLESLAVDIKTGRFKRARQLSGSLSAHLARGTVTVVFRPGNKT